MIISSEIDYIAQDLSAILRAAPRHLHSAIWAGFAGYYCNEHKEIDRAAEQVYRRIQSET